MNSLKIKKNDTVVILSGKDRGKQGKVLGTVPGEGKVVATSSARSSMMPEHRKMPPSRTRGRTVEARALMTSATMLATTTS